MTDFKQELELITRHRRSVLTPGICIATKNQVVSGPFAGMVITEQSSWGDGDAAPKLLGVYEQELYPSVEKIISANPLVVVNVGCAEGYYAVGMARRLPGSRVVGFDISQASTCTAGNNAIANNVDNIELGASCAASELEYLLENCGVGAVVSDCEGYETELLDIEQVPSLRHSYILVECHDMFSQGITDTLVERFTDTHDITKIYQGSRNPYQFKILDKYSDFDKWALMNEMRGETMHWLFMEPRN